MGRKEFYIIWGIFKSYASKFNHAEVMFSPQKTLVNHMNCCIIYLEETTHIYPDNFGGNYIEYDTLHVWAAAESAITHYKSFLSDFDLK